MKARITQLLALALFTIFSGSAAAATISIDIDSNSWDAQGSDNNALGVFDIAAEAGLEGDVLITGIGYNVNITTNGESWLSQVVLDISSFDGSDGIAITPGIGDDASGVGAYSVGNFLNLADLDLAFIANNGVIAFEIFESFDDITNSIDATITGTLSLQYESVSEVPVPTAVWLLGSGLLGLMGVRRRA